MKNIDSDYQTCTCKVCGGSGKILQKAVEGEKPEVIRCKECYGYGFVDLKKVMPNPEFDLKK